MSPIPHYQTTREDVNKEHRKVTTYHWLDRKRISWTCCSRHQPASWRGQLISTLMNGWTGRLHVQCTNRALLCALLFNFLKHKQHWCQFG